MLDLVREGWEGVRAHRVRSLLSALGILFGVSALIAILAIGEGARREQERLIDQLGVENFLVKAKTEWDDPKAEEEALRVSAGLSTRDVDALRLTLPAARHVGGMRLLDVPDLVPRPSPGQTVRVIGADLDYLAALGLVRREGRPLGPDDAAAAAPVCLLGTTARDVLFGGRAALGEHLRVGTVWLTVVGVVAAPGAGGGSAVQGVDIDDRDRDVILPLSTARVRFEPHPPELSEIIVAVGAVTDVPGHVDLAQRVVTRIHRGAADTTLVVPLRLLEQSRAQQRIFSLVMGMIAGISLLVGGIGIMNIMLASVMERTREVGIRLAVGARPRDIQALFLVEASLISLVGGSLGIVTGLVLSGLVAVATGWSTATSPGALLLAAALSMAEGVVFGWIPARNASRLSPAVAVRAT